jgi:hypothetical protein
MFHFKHNLSGKLFESSGKYLQDEAVGVRQGR